MIAAEDEDAVAKEDVVLVLEDVLELVGNLVPGDLVVTSPLLWK